MPIIVAAMLDTLISEIEQHVAARSMAGAPLAESTLGLRAVNDGKLMERLRGGGQITVGKAQRIREWIKADRVAMGMVSSVQGDTLPDPAAVGADAKAGVVQ